MKAILFLFVAPWSVLLRGLVLVKLWAWFIAPYFHVPELRIPIALGISTIVTLLTFHATKEDETGGVVPVLVAGFVSSLVALGFGALYRLFL
jgi:hypothetical protein